MAMNIFGKVLARLRRYRQARAEREALRLLIARKDEHMLRDVGLELIDTENAVLRRCEPLPQASERRRTAPLIRLLPPSHRKRDEGDTAASSNRGNGCEKPAA